jgi:protoheme IX farnesyltransferase
MKPRVMSLVIFTAVVGMSVAPGHIGPLAGIAAIFCIALGAGAAAVLNMWYDADIDAMMQRTAGRSIPCGRITRAEALAFGLASSVVAILLLGAVSNIAAAALLAFTIFFYAVIYTIWLKRRTPQNIVIGGAAGALPPIIGWVAVTGSVAVEPIILFLIIFLWTPPHFWALAIGRREDYATANIPMLPVVAGTTVTKQWILTYSILLLTISLLPWIIGFAGAAYGITAGSLGAIMIFLAARLFVGGRSDRAPSYRLFTFSIFYLFALFSALLVERLNLDHISSTILAI